jgi:hypothetical protein
MTLAESARAGASSLVTQYDGDEWLRIEHVDRVSPFMMTLTSDTDLWMFVSSAGGLTAGRGSPEGSLFPYVTVDLLHDAHHTTGPLTLLRVCRKHAPAVLWQPFASSDEPGPEVERHLYKSIVGDRILFEEVHRGLGLVFRYRWAACGAFGHVRTSTLEETLGEPATVEVLDGLRNVLPAGVPLSLIQHSSTLVDAYRRSECDAATGVGMYSLTSRITDRAEPGESLRANVVALAGLPGASITLSLDGARAFRRGEPVKAVHLVTGERGHYLARATLTLAPGATTRWHLVSDALRSQAEVVELVGRWGAVEDLGPVLESALARSRAGLRTLVARADGLQLTGQPVTNVHHFANVLFNVMRGGVFASGHEVPVRDFARFVEERDRRVAGRHAAWLASLRAPLRVGALREAAAATGDPDLERLAHEYLPLTFGRRHGDPSRPWNRFTIRTKGPDGGPALGFEGNWRDIFQNWEALALSFPAFLPSLVSVFVNASTVDGFNPYRLSRDGVDWEVEEPRNPWSNIGYWGDHQIVYLLRLLEAFHRAFPGELESMLSKRIFSYADVPYRIAPFEQILRDPHATIAFDHARARRIDERVHAFGTDGRRVTGDGERVTHVTLLEKLLVPVLAKLSNFVPGAGIWMNTQRPEWNDANNALAGNGVSVVTLQYLRCHLLFLQARLNGPGPEPVWLSTAVAGWLSAVRTALERDRPRRGMPARNPREQMALLCELGEAFSRYRALVYDTGLGEPVRLPLAEILALIDVSLAHVDDALDRSRRDDGLAHSYHRLEVDAGRDSLRVHPLELMLEGQVAALSSRRLSAADAVHVLDALFASPLYREDQLSFMLQPLRRLPGFLERNVIPERRARAIPLVKRVVPMGESAIVARDVSGTLRFHPDLRHAKDLRAALDALARRPGWADAVAADREAVLELYEDVFRHREFTGRSGAMHGYEGIGSVYWHMVAKLLLAVQECHQRAVRDGEDAATVAALAAHYRRVRAGLGYRRTPQEYGAFPTDPYSHTPAHGGARQPGMTGQVKEEILARFGELGVTFEDGRVAFRPRLLASSEFLAAPAVFECEGPDGAPRPVPLPAGSLAFTLALTPVVYVLTEGEAWLRVVGPDGTGSRRAGELLSAAETRALLGRDDAIRTIEVGVPSEVLSSD